MAVKLKRPERCPSWNIHTMAPKVAVSDRRFRTIAFNGTSRLPNTRNSRTKVTTAMMPKA